MVSNDLPLPINESLLNFRSDRFDGAGFEVQFDQFAPIDREYLRSIYRTVKELTDLANTASDEIDQAKVAAQIQRIPSSNLLQIAQQLGRETQSLGPVPAGVRAALHDIRGGGLAVLFGTAQLLEMDPGDRELIQHCVNVARDHAKIMRNLLPEIDPEVRARDEQSKAHQIEHFISKWNGMTVKGTHGIVNVSVMCDYRGAVTSRCLETSSIDRILYNLVNNAIRFSTGTVELMVKLSSPFLTRWIVRNQLDQTQIDFLQTNLDGQFERLFRGGITRGGQGIGLSACAQIIVDCFGLESIDQALKAGYLGAMLRDRDYITWFHWPTFSPATN